MGVGRKINLNFPIFINMTQVITFIKPKQTSSTSWFFHIMAVQMSGGSAVVQW